MSFRFDRTYRLLIGKKGETKNAILIEPPMRITFDVQKDVKSEPNENSIKIYNLSETTRKAIEQPNLRCVLYAGYAEENEPTLLCSGDIATAYSYRENGDIVTELFVLDGLIEIRDTAVSLGYSGGVSSQLILNDIAGKMGLKLVAGEELKERKWANGFSFYGAARTALDKIVHGTGLEWSVQNGELQVVNRAKVTRRQGVVLAVDSGLIGSPERVREAARSKKVDEKSKQKQPVSTDKQATDGWNVRSLLLPQINPADKVKVESSSVTGWFRAETVKHIGDSHSGDWQTELHLVERIIDEKAKKSGGKTKHRKKRRA
ncbi:phage protein [Pasteurellaceae bacterium 22721_9_1]